MSTAPSAHLRRRMPAASLAAGALAAAALGAGAVALVGGDATRAPSPSAAPAPAAQADGGTRLRTSFGAVSVDSVVRLTGSARPMGVRVGKGELPIQVAVTVTNLRERAFRVPASMLALTEARRGGIDPGSRPDFRVPALSAHRFVLRYAVPAGVVLPELLVRDPAGGAPVRVALGRTDDLTSLNVATHEFGGPVR